MDSLSSEQKVIGFAIGLLAGWGLVRFKDFCDRSRREEEWRRLSLGQRYGAYPVRPLAGDPDTEYGADDREAEALAREMGAII